MFLQKKNFTPSEEETALFDKQASADPESLSFNQRRQIIFTDRSIDKNQSNTKSIFRSICLVAIIVVIFLLLLFSFLQSQTQINQPNAQITKSPNLKLKDKHAQIVDRKKSVRKQQKQSNQQDTFAIQIQEKPKPSSPSQVPKENSIVSNDPWLETQKDSPMKDKYFFKVPIERLLQISNPQKFFGKNLAKQMNGLNFDQLQFSLNLMYVVHNVNFKGQVEVQMAPYQNDRQKKQQWIEKLLQVEKQIYEKKYEISKYMDNQLPFCIVTPSYNNVNSKLYLRYLDSIFMQEYQNYQIVYIDDASTDKTGQYVQRYIEQRKIPKEKIKVIINQKNVYALGNIYNSIHNQCKPGEIVMLIDGDDALVGRQVFSLFNAIYQRTQSALIYSTYLHVLFNEKAIIGASSRPIPPQLLRRHGGIRNQHAFFTSHLLTFYVDLFKQIKKQDLTYQNGTFYKYAYDVAMCTPMLQMIGDRVFYLPEITYQYRYDTGQNDQGSEQRSVTSLIYEKPVYQQLKQLPFVDDRQTYLKSLQNR